MDVSELLMWGHLDVVQTWFRITLQYLTASMPKAAVKCVDHWSDTSTSNYEIDSSCSTVSVQLMIQSTRLSKCDAESKFMTLRAKELQAFVGSGLD